MDEDTKEDTITVFKSSAEASLWHVVYTAFRSRLNTDEFSSTQADRSVAAWRERNTGGFEPITCAAPDYLRAHTIASRVLRDGVVRNQEDNDRYNRAFQAALED